MEDVKNSTCCFVGHRTINETKELKNHLYNEIEALITEKNVYIFLFGSRSEFNTLCYETVSKLKKKYPYIKRIYVRAEYPYIRDSYKKYLLQKYEDTYFPEEILNAGKLRYIKRNAEMIDKSSFGIFYYDKNYLPEKTNSGTKIAYNYALKNEMTIINMFFNP